MRIDRFRVETTRYACGRKTCASMNVMRLPDLADGSQPAKARYGYFLDSSASTVCITAVE